MFLVGRSYKRKLEPVGPSIVLYEHEMAFLHARVRYARKQPYHTNIITILSHILHYIFDSPTKFRFIPWLGF